MTLPGRRRRRPAQRRQVDAGQPHRRPPRGDRRGAARRHPRPQGGRGRVERPRRSSWSTPAAGWPAATRLDDKVSRQAERAIADADVVLFVVDVDRRRHRRGRPGRRAAPPRRARRCCSWPTRSTTPAARPTIWELARARPRRPVRRSAPCTAGAPATCSTRSSSRFAGRRRRPTTSRRAPAPTAGRRGRRPCRRRHRRPAQRGQVDAVQPADRRRALGRPRPARHHPRHHRHGRRDRRRARSASSTPPACAASPRIDEGTEYYSLVRALQAIDEADVALLVIDATEGVTHQDQRLAERVDAAGCPVVVAAQQVGAARRRAREPTSLTRSADRLALPRRRAGAARSAP